MAADEVLEIRVSDAITIREWLKERAKHQGIKGYVFEMISGDEFSQGQGQWVRKARLIDWQNDWYEEVVTDPETGAIIHECSEPLSEHRGHGSAKRK
jgi:hypothetical protein